jgi:hypothetical protein
MPSADLWLCFAIDDFAIRNSDGLGIEWFTLSCPQNYQHSIIPVVSKTDGAFNYHQDVRLWNILTNNEDRGLVDADVGPVGAGTIQYAAPELGEEFEWTTKIDVCSFGLIVHELLAGSPVFREDHAP